MAVYIFSNLLSGSTGLDKSLVMTANHLHRAGHQVTVVNFLGRADGTQYLMPRWPFDLGLNVRPLQTLPAEGGRLLHRNFHPIVKDRIPNLNYSFTANAFAALRQLNQALGSDDVIIFTHPLQAMIFEQAIVDDERGVRTVIQIHGDYKARHPELGPMLSGARRVIDDVQIVSTGMADDYVAEFGAERVHWIPNIHEPSHVERSEHAGVNVVLVGSFQDAKNQLDAVRMLQRVEQPDVRLTLWGNDATPYGEHVRAYVRAHGLEERVTFAGIGTESDIYGAADIVVLPSRSEGFGYALIEAASHSLPVVAYDYDYGPRDVIDDGRSGFIVAEGDVAGLAAKVARLAADESLRHDIGAAARLAFELRFAPDRVVERYNGLLGSPTAARGASIDEIFQVDGEDPFDSNGVRSKSVRVRGRTLLHIVEVPSNQKLVDFRVDSGRGVKRARALRFRGRYVVPLLRGNPGRRFYRAAQRVLSCTTSDPALGRFYVGNTTRKGRFETAQYLLRQPHVRLAADGKTLFRVDNGRLGVARHPRFPVVAAIDGAGEPANTRGGVEVTNAGSIVKPVISIVGEFDSVEFFDGLARRRFSSPFGYAELFERICHAEREHGLFEMTTDDGVHPWELYRAAFVATISEALGFWGTQFSPAGVDNWDMFYGTKRLRDGRRFDRVLFEFPRKPDGIDHRTSAFHGDDLMIIEYPQDYGYSSAVYTEPNRFPIREFHLWRAEAAVPLDDRIDPRPFERALSESLGFPVTIGGNLARRVRKFVEERDFWTSVFREIEPNEVIIPSSHWSAGICEAARAVGATAADIQYALTSRYHPSFWFGDQPRHGASLLYAWSPFWTDRTNVYERFETVERRFPDGLDDSFETRWDLCVVSQPRVFRRVSRFVEQLVAARPDLKVCVAPHPDERYEFEQKLAGPLRREQVSIAPGATLDAIKQSAMCVGGYSTSMYEAAALGKPTFVLPVPGHEIVQDDIDSGLFRLCTSPEDLKLYEVPEWSTRLFGAAVPTIR